MESNPTFSIFTSVYFASKASFYNILIFHFILQIISNKKGQKHLCNFTLEFKSRFFNKDKDFRIVQFILRTGAAHPLPYFSGCGCTRSTCSNADPALCSPPLRYGHQLWMVPKTKDLIIILLILSHTYIHTCMYHCRMKMI